MITDTQVHVFDTGRFPLPAGAGYRPLPGEAGSADELATEMRSAGVGRAVLVQPSGYGTDNRALLAALSRAPDRLRAVVMAAPGELAGLAQTPGVAGVRLNLTDYPPHRDPGLLRETLATALRLGLVTQIQAAPSDWGKIENDLPETATIILDHLGRCDPRQIGDARVLSDLAKLPGTVLKLSAPFRLGGGWPMPGDGLATILAAFGPRRILWGSDWPFLNLAGERPTYGATLEWGRVVAGGWSETVLVSNPARVFGFADG